MTSVCPAPVYPTAHAFEPDVAVTPFRKSPEPGLGTLASFHDFPPQRSARVWLALASPTAHALVGDAAAMPNRKSLLLTSGAETVLHFFPFQCRISEWPVPTAPIPPGVGSRCSGDAVESATGTRLRRGRLRLGRADPALDKRVRATAGRAHRPGLTDRHRPAP